jgi:hypothetical protein
MREIARNRSLVSLAGAFAGAVLFGTAGLARGSINVDGTLDPAYGSPLSTQTVNTAFGDSTVGDGTSAGGSELDAAYASVQNNTLYLFLSGNLEESGGSPNHLNIFIADGRSGQSTLSASGGPLNAANGLVFPAGFSATFAIDTNDFSNTMYTDTYDLIGNTQSYAGGVSLAGGIGNGTLSGGLSAAGFNNTNAAGVNGSGGTAASASAADAVTTGFEYAIPLSTLGNPAPGTYIQVIAGINGGGDSYYSNQFLGGLPVGYGNLATGSPNLNGIVTPIVVSVPEPSGALLFGFAGGFLALSSRRSRRVALASR